MARGYLALFPMREVLEGHVAAMAAARMTPEESAALLELARRLQDTDARSEDASALDSDYHEMIGRGSGDEMITELLNTILRRARHYHVYGQNGAGDERKRESDLTHIRIAEAIAARDPESARLLMVWHIRTTREWLEAIWPAPTVP